MARTTRIQDVKLRGLGPTDQAHARERILASLGRFLPRLIACAAGDIDMTSSQVRAGVALMAKVLPDLKSSDVTIYDPNAGLTEGEMVAKLKEMVKESPELWALLTEDLAPH